MSWIDFLMNGEGSQIDASWATRCVSELRYDAPPPAVATIGGRSGPVSGMAVSTHLRDRIWRTLPRMITFYVSDSWAPARHFVSPKNWYHWDC